MERVRTFGLTDIGRVRLENQDAFHIDAVAGFFIVADGLGGMQDGALAARFVVTALAERLREAVSPPAPVQPADLPGFMRRGLTEISAALCKATGGCSGSTAVVACLAGNKAVIANTGDSPAYLFRDGKLKRLTREHNIAGLLVEQGRLSKAEARVHPLHHQLFSFVGINRGITVHLAEADLAGGDRLLLCSDGLNGMLDDQEIIRTLAAESDTSTAVRELIRAANESGGFDNITAVLLDIG